MSVCWLESASIQRYRSRLAAANSILRYVRRGKIHSVATFDDTDAEAIEIEVDAQSTAVGKSLQELPLPSGAVVGGILRKGEAFVPTGATDIRPGDHLIIFALPKAIERVEELFSRVKPVEPRSAWRGFLRIRGPMIPRLAYVIGAVVMASAAAMIPAIVTSLIYREWDVAVQISIAAVITLLCGFIGWRYIGKSGVLTTKEGFATVGLSWFSMAFLRNVALSLHPLNH